MFARGSGSHLTLYTRTLFFSNHINVDVIKNGVIKLLFLMTLMIASADLVGLDDCYDYVLVIDLHGGIVT